MLEILLFGAAFIFFGLATFGVGGRFNLVAGGLGLWVLAEHILPAIVKG